jgi:hypothetical protein
VTFKYTRIHVGNVWRWKFRSHQHAIDHLLAVHQIVAGGSASESVIPRAPQRASPTSTAFATHTYATRASKRTERGGLSNSDGGATPPAEYVHRTIAGGSAHRQQKTGKIGVTHRGVRGGSFGEDSREQTIDASRREVSPAFLHGEVAKGAATSGDDLGGSTTGSKRRADTRDHGSKRHRKDPVAAMHDGCDPVDVIAAPSRAVAGVKNRTQDGHFSEIIPDHDQHSPAAASTVVHPQQIQSIRMPPFVGAEVRRSPSPAAPLDQRVSEATDDSRPYAPQDGFSYHGIPNSTCKDASVHDSVDRDSAWREPTGNVPIHEERKVQAGIPQMTQKYAALEEALAASKKENETLKQSHRDLLVQHRKAQKAWHKEREELFAQLHERRTIDGFGEALRSRLAALTVMQPEEVDIILQQLDHAIAEEMLSQKNEMESSA